MVKENEKPLYKPFPSKRAGKKFSVYVKGPSGNKKLIHFGAKGMDDWRSGTATKEQRKSYRARASGIRDKNGNLTYKNKNTPNYWAYHYLW
jgi:hypothetical protein|tara:strand:- start:764 stop:1036 length:273 start_codon:yes stop_codon:yes gene_type:complete